MMMMMMMYLADTEYKHGPPRFNVFDVKPPPGLGKQSSPHDECQNLGRLLIVTVGACHQIKSQTWTSAFQVGSAWFAILVDSVYSTVVLR
jgi:hypothetical protein